MRLEGRLRSADLAVLESSLAEVGAGALALDLAELHWLDAPAVERLSALVRGGARIVSTSPFVERLLEDRDRPTPSEHVSRPDSGDPRSN
jgi:hypothetical protein